MDQLVIEFTFAAQINWSLLQIGVPLIFGFKVTGDGASEDMLTIELRITDYLKPVKLRITAMDRQTGRDLSGDIRPLLTHRWLMVNAWQTPRSTDDLILEIDGLSVESIAVPLRVLPADYWQPITFEMIHDHIQVPVCKATLTIHENTTNTVITEDVLRFSVGEWPYPPPMAAIAALIDQNNPYMQLKTLEHGFATILFNAVKAMLEKDADSENISADQSLRGLVSLGIESVQYDFLGRRLPKPMIQGNSYSSFNYARLACECLEAQGRHPIFFFGTGNNPAAFGLWSSDKGEKFAYDQIVCTSRDEINQLIEAHKIRLVDAASAIAGKPYETAIDDSGWETFKESFLCAVDITAARAWNKQSGQPGIQPLRRQYPVIDKIPTYLKRLLETETNRIKVVEGTVLDDPVELFVPLQCSDTQGIVYPLLNVETRTGWLLEQVIYRPGKVALLADGGAGKSYICRRLALEVARQFLETEGNIVPILFPLQQLGRNEHLLDAIAHWVNYADADEFRYAVHDTRLLLILDALDESDFARANNTQAQYVELFKSLEDVPGVSVILTARSALFAGAIQDYLPGFEITFLQSWTLQEFGSFVRLCEIVKGIAFKGGWQTFAQRIVDGSTNLRNLAQTPLFARMIVETHEDIESQGDVRDELDLYRRYTLRSFKRREELGIPVNEAHEATAQIALAMYVQQRSALHNRDIVNSLASYLRKRDVETYRQFVNDVIVSGLLGRESEHTYRFTHSSIEHYFLAEQLALELLYPANPQKYSQLFGHAPLTTSVLRFLAQALINDSTVVQNLSTRLHMRFTSDRRNILTTANIQGARVNPNVAFRNLLLICFYAGGNLTRLNLEGVDLSGVELVNADLSDSNLTRCHLRGANLSGARLISCVLIECDLREANVTGVDFLNANLARCNLTHIWVEDVEQLPNFTFVQGFREIKLDFDGDATLMLLLECVQHWSSMGKEWADDTVNFLRSLLGRRD